jgi:hypothetical protein
MLKILRVFVKGDQIGKRAPDVHRNPQTHALASLPIVSNK